jgi:hypothetical protein
MSTSPVIRPAAAAVAVMLAVGFAAPIACGPRYEDTGQGPAAWGVVRDAQSAAPIARITVICTGGASYSDDWGYFAIRGAAEQLGDDGQRYFQCHFEDDQRRYDKKDQNIAIGVGPANNTVLLQKSP